MQLANSHATSSRRLTRPRPNSIWGAATAFALLLFAYCACAETVLDTIETDEHKVRVVEVTTGLHRPWSLAFLPDGDFLVTERSGRLWQISNDGERWTEISNVPNVYAVRQGGLFDVVLDPAFAENNRLYLSYAAPIPGGHIANTNVVSATLVEDRLEDVTVIFQGSPPQSGGAHFGGRMVFMPDGTLTLTTGDRGRKRPSQQLNHHGGSVIRINTDGTPIPDAPFAERRGALPEIFTYGHRNPQGAALNPATGELWTHEHGPRGGDEVNIIRRGQNYGWPLVSHGQNYSGTPVNRGESAGPGITEPVHTWVPSIAPSGMAFYNGEAFPGWKGNILVGALKFQLVARLTLDGDNVIGEERFLNNKYGRIRDVRVGPNGLVYLLTDERKGQLLRLEPAD